MRTVALIALLLVSTAANAQDSFKNRWWPNDEPIPKGAPSMQSTTTTTTTTPDKTTTVTTTSPWVCCQAPLPGPPVQNPPAQPWTQAPAPAPVPKVVPAPVPRPQYRGKYYEPHGRYYEPSYEIPCECEPHRWTDLSVPADRVTRGTANCNGVGCY